MVFCEVFLGLLDLVMLGFWGVFVCWNLVEYGLWVFKRVVLEGIPNQVSIKLENHLTA